MIGNKKSKKQAIFRYWFAYRPPNYPDEIFDKFETMIRKFETESKRISGHAVIGNYPVADPLATM
jgi:hypothetical protein